MTLRQPWPRRAVGAVRCGAVPLLWSAAVEHGPHGVRVNAVADGAVRTPQMSDIASASIFLPFPLAACITGQTLVADGERREVPVHRPSAIGGE
ncbi:SDR family oxidoreductase [Streptomyces sp. H27-C3]|uniref:SDR family oxidoreductase n=1 Tax=Streptomyces sp. H27-C3 TaxID=3046305 RepID=UPI0024BB6A4D|nr:SDR family oxidoreductase [Streptomyces sp. H27-C3]MDJ0464767.1 SDR family oxidoreductase [Streptomyces sp. H27-C3]